MSRPELAAEDILASLDRHGEEYVIIGAFAAIAQGAPIEATHDVAVTPWHNPGNLRQLSDACRESGRSSAFRGRSETSHPKPRRTRPYREFMGWVEH